MELRHLRYFVAIAEEGSFTQAAEKRLHTAQPSLSRQIRDLETELGVTLLIRGARGIELTPAGKVFLDHARMVFLQVEAATEAARRAAVPPKTSFTIGFLSGYEVDWLPPSCAYRRIEEGRGLAPWHPLRSGTTKTVLTSGASACGRIISERDAGMLEHHVVDWPGRNPRVSRQG